MNNNLIKKLEDLKTDKFIYEISLNDLSIDDYIPNIDDYYYEIASILNVVDKLVQILFTKGTIDFSYKHFNNKIIGIILYNILRNRLEREHQVNTSQQRYSNYSHNIDVANQNFTFTLKYNRPDYIEFNRMTGASTRLCDDFIHDMLLNPKVNILVTDNYTEYCRRNDRCRGSYIMSAGPADRMLMDHIRRRLESELPECVMKMVKINKMGSIIMFNHERINKQSARMCDFE